MRAPRPSPRKPAFRKALEKRRCIVPATGFYEWQGAPGQKQPFAITFPEAPVFGFAGLWERWRPEAGDPVDTFTIVTTDANEAVGSIHDRMPVILSPEQAGHLAFSRRARPPARSSNPSRARRRCAR
jgi:putative SOS response-associated peptidase YedK